MGVLAAGLDARAAAIVMRSMRNIVSTGRTIVCEPPFFRFTLRPWYPCLGQLQDGSSFCG